MTMCKIKICGLRRREDIGYVNRALPDFAGFIINYPKSHRSCSVDKVRELCSRLDERILPVGVFVNEDPETVAGLLKEDTISLAQLHGSESPEMIRWLQKETKKPVIKAFKIRNEDDIEEALQSPADYILLDQGYGGGQTFDWNLVPEIKRPWFLAGGLNSDNMAEAIERLEPWAVDLSSSVEIDKKKDEQLICQAVQLVRENR